MIEKQEEFASRTIQIKRVSKKTKGGNRISFTALVVVGDGKGKLGAALGKAKDVASAIQKAERRAKQDAFLIPLVNGTIPHPVWVKFKATKVLLKPAKPGRGIIAGGPIRVMAQLAGVENIVAKIFGSRNKQTVVWAGIKAFAQLKGGDNE